MFVAYLPTCIHIGQPLDNLQLLLREVFLPLACLSGPEDGGSLDKLLDVLHCILGSVEVLSHHTKVCVYIR